MKVGTKNSLKNDSRTIKVYMIVLFKRMSATSDFTATDVSIKLV